MQKRNRWKTAARQWDAEDGGNRGMSCRLGSKSPPGHELTGAFPVIGAYLMGRRPGGAQQPWQGAMLLTSALFLMQIKPGMPLPKPQMCIRWNYKSTLSCVSRPGGYRA